VFTLVEVDAIALELSDAYKPLPAFVAMTAATSTAAPAT